MSEEEKKIIGEIDISKTLESNIDYWRNKCFEQQREIKELKELVHEKTEILDVGDAVITFNKTHENCISKDKIRETISNRGNWLIDDYVDAVMKIDKLLED